MVAVATSLKTFNKPFVSEWFVNLQIEVDGMRPKRGLLEGQEKPWS
jgi:hypothetical protein